MRKIFYSIVLLIGIFYSCKKTDIGVDNLDLTQSYRLKKEIHNPNERTEAVDSYFYNENGLISRIESVRRTFYVMHSGQVVDEIDTVLQTFEYTNGLCTKWNIQKKGSPFILDYYEFNYNTKNLPVSRIHYKKEAPTEYRSYVYDNSDRLIKVTDTVNTSQYRRYEFTYGKDNNIESIAEYNGNKITYVSLDDMVNYTKAIKGLPLSFAFDESYPSYPSYFSLSPHNKLIEVSQSGYGTKDTISYLYQYNEVGLPVNRKTSPGGATVIFEYEKK
ncbi:MAG: hypothetical protein NVV82_11915 [Sporocytophaga sp.]|nr:hypothetical protein [Sporocytophaga sp.]